MSIPAETPAAVTISPSSTKRASSSTRTSNRSQRVERAPVRRRGPPVEQAGLARRRAHRCRRSSSACRAPRARASAPGTRSSAWSGLVLPPGSTSRSRRPTSAHAPSGITRKPCAHVTGSADSATVWTLIAPVAEASPGGEHLVRAGEVELLDPVPESDRDPVVVSRPEPCRTVAATVAKHARKWGNSETSACLLRPRPVSDTCRDA